MAKHFGKIFPNTFSNSASTSMLDDLNPSYYYGGNQLQLYATCYTRKRMLWSPTYDGDHSQFPFDRYDFSDVPQYMGNNSYTPSTTSLSAVSAANSKSSESLISVSKTNLATDVPMCNLTCDLMSTCEKCSWSQSSESGFSSNGSGTSTAERRHHVIKSDCDKSRDSFHERLGYDLWKDNADHDIYNTFSVSEAEVTQVIHYLENSLLLNGENKSNLNRPVGHEGSCCDSYKPVEHGGSSSNITSKESVPLKVTFIMDTYCSIYMNG